MSNKMTTTALLVAVLLLMNLFPAASSAAPDDGFPDTRGHWAEADINFLAEKGVIGGYTDGNFYPGKNISRRELAKIVFTLFPAGARTLPGTAAGNPDYPDIHAGWGQNYLEAAVNYLPGFTDGHFNPDTPATRFEVAWLALAATLVEEGRYKVENGNLFLELPLPDQAAWQKLIQFREYANLPERYRKSTAYLPEDPGKNDFYSYAGYFFTDQNPVALLAGAGILKGFTDGSMGLDREVTRAETVAIVSRVFNTDLASSDRYVLEPAGKVYRPRVTGSPAAAQLDKAGAFYRAKYSDPLQRARIIYNLMVHVFNYDWDTREGFEQQTAADAAGLMRTGKGADAALADYYTTLAVKSGLNAKTVKGRATNPGDSGPHTWVELTVDGKTVPVDPTYGVCTGELYLGNFDQWSARGYQWVKE